MLTVSRKMKKRAVNFATVALKISETRENLHLNDAQFQSSNDDNDDNADNTIARSPLCPASTNTESHPIVDASFAFYRCSVDPPSPLQHLMNGGHIPKTPKASPLYL